MAIQGGTVRWVVEADTSSFEASMKKVEESAKNIGKSVDEPAKQVDKSLQSIRASVKLTHEAFSQMAGGFKTLSLGSVQAGLTSIGTTMAGLTAKGLSLGSSLESNKLSFKALTGSAEGSREVLTAVADFAAENPFQMLDVSNVAKKFVAMSIPAKDVARHLNTVGKVSVASGASLEGVGHVFSQVAAQGKLMTQDMYQLVNQGVAIMPALSRVTGKSMEQLREDMSEGRISFEMMTKAMNAIVPDDMAKQLQLDMFNTIPRQLDRLKGSISTFATELVGINKKTGDKLENGIAQAYTNVLKELANGIRNPKLLASVAELGKSFAPLLQKVADKLPALFDTLAIAVDKLAKNSKLLVPIIAGVGLTFGGLASNLPVVGPILGNISGGAKDLAFGFLKLGKANPILAGIVALFTVGFANAYKNNEEFRNSIGRLVSALLKLGGNLGTSLIPIIDSFTKIASSDAFIKVLNGLVNVLTIFIDTLAKIPTEVLTGLITAFIGFKAVSSVGATIATFSKGFKTLSTAANSVVNPMAKAGKAVAGVTRGGKLTKGQTLMNTMRSGLINLILLAGAIAALGFALKYANNAIPNDLGKLVEKLTVMTVITGVMSGFAIAIGKLKIKPRDMLTLAGIAGVIALVGLSLKYAYTTIPPDLVGLSAKIGVLTGSVAAIGILASLASKLKIKPQSLLILVGIAGVIAVAGLALQVANNAITAELGLLGAKLGVMAGALIGMGVLGVVASKLSKSLPTGLLLVVAISGTLALAGLSLGYVNSVMPNNLGLLGAKLGVMAGALIGMGLLAGIISNFSASIVTGLLVIVAISGTLALTGLSLGYANSVIPDNLGLLSAKLGVMAGAIAGMSVIAGVVSIFSVAIVTGLGVVALVAGSIAVTALAMNTANHLIPEDLKQFGKKLLVLGGAITGMTVLAGVIGAIVSTGIGAVFIGAGLATMLAIAGGIVAIAVGIAVINKAVPNDVNAVAKKIDVITQTLGYIAGANLGNVLNNIGQAINIQPLKALISAYVSIATDLAKIASIQINPVPVLMKIGVIKGVVEQVSRTDGDSPAGIMKTAVNNFLNVINVAAIGQTVKIYADIAETLQKIQNIQIDPATIVVKIAILKSIIQTVSSKGEDFMGAIKGAIANWANASSTESASKVIGIYSGLSENLNKIAEMKIEENTIKNNIGALNRVMETVFNAKGNGGLFGAIGDFFNGGLDIGQVENVLKIMQKMEEIANVALKIKDVSPASTSIDNMKSLLEKIRDFPSPGNIGEKEHLVGMATSITYKMSELGNAINLINVAKDASERIKKGTDAVWNVFQINQGVGDMGFKEHIVRMATSIAYKMGELGGAINLITIPDNAGDRIKKSTDSLWNIFQINQAVGDMGYKEHIVGMATSIAYKMGEFSNALRTISPIENASAIVNNIVNAMNTLFSSVHQSVSANIHLMKTSGESMGLQISEGIRSKTGDVQQAGLQLQNSLWTAIESKMMDEFWQGSTMATKFNEGLRTQLNAIAQSGRDMQGSFWNAIEPKMADEYHQGRALAGKLIEGINSQRGGLENSGRHAVNGFLSGAGSNWNSVYNMGQRIAGEFLRGVIVRGDQHSPWKTTYQSGIFAGQGLVNGILSMEDSLYDTAWSVTDTVVGIFENMNDTFQPKIVPEVSGTKASEHFISGGGNNGPRVIIEQTNNNYTQYSIDQMNRDLEWQLRKV